jgi:hypothetical protein
MVICVLLYLITTAFLQGWLEGATRNSNEDR